MSSARANANQSLYLGKILLDAWQQALEQQVVPAITLEQAFAPAVRNHLLDAFGWFALNILGIGDMPARPPHRCDELPDVVAGKALPGEIREFRQLEQGGWLGDLQAAVSLPGPVARSAGNLASNRQQAIDHETMAGWTRDLEALFERMGDSLDEC